MQRFTRIVIAMLTFLFVGPILSVVSAAENTNNDIKIQVELQADGSAIVTERREAELYEDTELYIRLVNLQDSELLDFSVDGFREERNWDIDDSFSEKANKYGVIDIDNGYELAWGISEYGDQVYNLTYTLSNLVRNLDDGQALLWDFDTFTSLPTERLELEISAPFMLEDEILHYYGFGFEGPIDIIDGRLKWTGYGLDDSNDVTVLLQFPSNTFQTAANVDMTLAEQREMATAGSSYNEEPPMPLWAKLLIGLAATMGIGGAVASVAFVWQNQKTRKEYNHFFPHTLAKEVGDRIQRTPPQLAGDYGKYAALIRKVFPAAGTFTDYFFVYLLLWSKEDLITIETTTTERRLLRDKETSKMTIKNFDQEVELNTLTFAEYVALFKLGESTVEEVMWSILFEAADNQGVIMSEDMSDWSYKNAEAIGEFLESMNEVSLEWLVENNYFEVYTVEKWRMKIVIEELTEKGEALVTEMYQYHNFIAEIEDQQVQQYDYWDDLMIWAVLFGRGEELVENLEEFHPATWNHVSEAYPYYYGNYYGYHYFYTHTNSGLSSAGHGDAGGGGMSSSGGGGGAGGGGGGGSR